MSAVCGPYRPFPTFMRAGGAQSCSSGGSRSLRKQVAHLLGLQLERHVLCSQLSLALSSGRATATQGLLDMGSVIAASSWR